MKPSLLLCAVSTLFSCLARGWPSDPTCTRPNTTELKYWGDGDGLNKIYDALVTCPNITSLDLDFDWSGCVAPSEPWAFQFREGDRFPALRKLSLSDYDLEDRWRYDRWHYDKWSFKQKAVYAWRLVPQFFSKVFAGEFDELFWIQADMDPPRESNLDKWLRAMEFSQLESLRLEQRDDVFYERMKDGLPGLKTLSVSWMNSGAETPRQRIEFIKSLPPLESLSISIGVPYYYDNGPKNRTAFPLEAILDTHGQSLRSLALTQPEAQEANLRRPMFSVDEIGRIARSCQNLRNLTLDIDRDASYGWPNATLDALTRLESIDTLTLRLELGSDLHSPHESGTYGRNPLGLGDANEVVREPRMTSDVAEALFQDVSAKKAGSELKRVEFVVGNVEEKPYSGPLYFPYWDEGRARTFVCEAGVDAGQHCSMIDPNYRDNYDWLDR